MLYSGDNDIQSGKSAETVFDDVVTFTDKIHAAVLKPFLLKKSSTSG